MKTLKRYLLGFWLAVLSQFILVTVGFYKIVINGQMYALMDKYDGIRNYFAFTEYISQKSSSKSYFLFENMNYPFGDYIFYTDNTPLFAVVMKWFSTHIYDISNDSLQIYHWILVYSLVLSTILIYLIGKNIIKTKWLLTIFSVTLPWLTPQFFRFSNGHFGLALSCCLLVTIYGLVVLYQRFQQNKNITIPIIGIILCVLLSSFVHVYFLLINGFFIGYFGLAWAVFNFKIKKTFWKILSIAMGVPLACLGIFLLLINSIDTYYPHRSITANGFRWSEWQLKIDALYHTHDFFTIPFAKSALTLHYESIAYLGSFAVYSTILFLSIFAIKKFSRATFKKYMNGNPTAQLVSILLISGMGCLFVAFGTKALFFNEVLRFDNWLNPLYWLVEFIPQVTQFRCMARFNWMFFLTFNFFLLYVLDQYFQNHSHRKTTWLMVLILPTLMVIDTLDMVKFTQQRKLQQPLTHIEQLNAVNTLLQGIDVKKYQAILPIPYYNSSCEDYNYTIDPEDNWCTTTFQFSKHTGLPLMASKMGRTPLNQTYAQFELFLNYKIPALIRNGLNEKPILVIYNTNEAAWQNIPQHQPAQQAFLNGKTFPEKMKMKELKSLGDWKVFELRIRN